jgi:hypothetical protein
VADFGDDVFGEEITNKIPGIGARPARERPHHEMCLFYADFKHSMMPKRKDFRRLGKVPSIMSAKGLSIMRANDGRGTFD